ncbi:hypothetical protein D6D18_06588 [Aureobasidium pullulans]|nr:hypothetical protein D6D29_05108 [Aureobasidium pullulans]THW91200.1 hypothetical protein D6D18_06588 [Aureobasidium pullulans]
MNTIIPSADTAFGRSDGMLKSMSTVVTEILDTNPRGYTRPMFFFETPYGVD